MFYNLNVNLRKNKGFLAYIPYSPIPEYSRSNAPLVAHNSCTTIWRSTYREKIKCSEQQNN